MNEIKILDLTKYGEDKEVRLENLCVINYRIVYLEITGRKEV